MVPEKLRPEGGPVPRLRRWGAGGVSDVFHRARIVCRRHRAGTFFRSTGIGRPVVGISRPVDRSVFRSVNRSVLVSCVGHHLRGGVRGSDLALFVHHEFMVCGGSRIISLCV